MLFDLQCGHAKILSSFDGDAVICQTCAEEAGDLGSQLLGKSTTIPDSVPKKLPLQGYAPISVPEHYYEPTEAASKVACPICGLQGSLATDSSLVVKYGSPS